MFCDVEPVTGEEKDEDIQTGRGAGKSLAGLSWDRNSATNCAFHLSYTTFSEVLSPSELVMAYHHVVDSLLNVRRPVDLHSSTTPFS